MSGQVVRTPATVSTNEAVSRVGAAGRDAEAPGHQLKKSPTLLFDLLAEPDKEKQQQKLLRATVGPSGLQSQPQPQQPSNPVSVPHSRAPGPDHQHQQGRAKDSQDRTSARFLAPDTPDLRQGPPGCTAGVSAGDTTSQSESSSGGYGTSSVSSGFPRVSDAAAALGRTAAGLEGTQRGSRLHLPGQQQQQDGKAAPSGGGAPDGPGTAAGGGSSAGGVPAAAAAAGGPEATAAATGAGPPAVDPLSVFTPRVILQELLGELFIPPERLVKQGTFGQGAFATVQSCSLEDPGGGPSLLVAVKSLKPEVLADIEDLRRFLLEANLVRKLRHPNIVSIHGLGAHRLCSLEALRSSAYVVMEALEGGDLRMMVLRQMTGRSAAYSRLDALRWCLHIAAGCAYLHETCRPLVIHRDLKLENVMLTGGPTDNRVAKITDFGLHKRARYSRTEDVLIAVTNEWSTHGGSIYRAAGGGGGSEVYAYGGRLDASMRGGSMAEASYYGGGAFAGDGLLSGPSLHRHADGSSRGGGNNGNNRSSSSRYVAMAAAGMAAVAANAASTAATTGARPRGGSCGGGSASGDLAFAEVMTTGVDLSYGGGGGGASVGRASSTGPGDSLRAGSEAAAALGLPGGQGSTAAANGNGKPVTERERPYLLAFDKRYDALPTASKWNSTNDLVAMHDTAVASAAAAGAAAALTSATTAAAAAAAAAGTPPIRSPFASDVLQQHQPHGPDRQGHQAGSGSVPAASPPLSPLYSGPLYSGPLRPSASQPPGWIPPNVVPPAAVEESVHRKMMALMALESAAAAAAAAAAATNTTGTTAAMNGGGSDAIVAAPAAAAVAADGGSSGDGAAEPFSVTEFIRAATSLPGADGVGPAGPSAVMLMRSMSLALQQQRLEEQHQQQQQLGGGGAAPPPDGAARQAATPATAPISPLSPVLGFPAALGLAAGAPPPRAARTASTAMKTVPEHNRMSMDLGGGMRASRTSSKGTGAGEGSAPGLAGKPLGGSGKGAAATATAASRREKAVAAAARMADATRQVGSLIYMAPELVLSGNYNEKVDVFSFAIIAYELFSGKLLAMKVANEFAAQQMQSSWGPHAAVPPAGAGGGLGASSPLPLPGSRSAEADVEAGVMAYVMRRSTTGARETMPSWWPAQLRALIGRCWAQDPAERPSFSQIHREMRRMQADGSLKEMDSKDPLRDMGCGCTIS